MIIFKPNLHHHHYFPITLLWSDCHRDKLAKLPFCFIFLLLFQEDNYVRRWHPPSYSCLQTFDWARAFPNNRKAVITHEQTPDLVPDLCESLFSSKFMRNFWCFRKVWNQADVFLNCDESDVFLNTLDFYFLSTAVTSQKSFCGPVCMEI